MGLLLSAFSLSAIVQTDKQTIYSFNHRSAYDTILQYLHYSDHNDDNNINYKNYLHIGPCTQYGKMTVRNTLIRVKTTFKVAKNLDCKIS